MNVNSIKLDKGFFIIDTNVLIHDPESIFKFHDNIVAIPMVVLEELDQFKSESSERGRNSRQVIRHLDNLRMHGSLSEGVDLDNGGILKILLIKPEVEFPEMLTEGIVDNQILSIALYYKEQGYNVKFISQDLNARVKADALNIESQEYLDNTIKEKKIYSGWSTIEVPAVQLKEGIPDDILKLAKEREFTLNEFIMAASRNNPNNYAIFRYIGDNNFKKVNPPKLKWPLEPKNPQQLMALDLLLDNSIQLVSLIGAAGTGKTFLALLSALHQVLIEEEYEKMLISRPVIPLGPDIGFLPGDIQEKLHSWMQPVHDNMEFIIHAANMNLASGIYNDMPISKGRKKFRDRRGFNKGKIIPPLERLIKDNKVSLEAITYMRGRSIPYQFIIIDEVQNLTTHEIKTIITRAGEGSKIVLLGDPYQIDSAYLDFNTNGLMVATSKFKDQKIFGTVFLETTERSELSKLAGELL